MTLVDEAIAHAKELGQDDSLPIIQQIRVPPALAVETEDSAPWIAALLTEYATVDRRWLVQFFMREEINDDFTVRLPTAEQAYAYIAGTTLQMLNSPPEGEDE